MLQMRLGQAHIATAAHLTHSHPLGERSFYSRSLPIFPRKHFRALPLPRRPQGPWIDFTQPAVSFCITARAFATHGKLPVTTLPPYRSRAWASVRPTLAISGSM